MACNEDQVVITSQLLKTMMETMEIFKVVMSLGDDVKSIAEEVRQNKEDNERRNIECPTTADIIFINKTLQENLMEARKSSEGMKTMEDRMTCVENTLTAINETLNNVKESHTMQARKSSDEMKIMKNRMTRVENTLTTINGTLNNVKESHTNVENTLKAIEESNSQMNTMLKRTPRYGYTTQFDAEHKGKKVIFSNDFRTAVRTKPTESSSGASVVSNSPLEDDEVFQIRIDERIDTFSFGIAIGVMEEKTEGIKDADYITWNRDIKGTWAIFSLNETPSGRSNTYNDGKRITTGGYPLPTNNLPVGTLLGVSRRSNGNLHFYLNGVDKGAAFVNVTKDVYAFVDVVNYVTKISITN